MDDKRREEKIKAKEAKKKNRGGLNKGHYIKASFFGGVDRWCAGRPNIYGWMVFSIVMGFVLAITSLILYRVLEVLFSKATGTYPSKTIELVKQFKMYHSLALVVVCVIWGAIVLVGVINACLRAASAKGSNQPYKPTGVIVLGIIVLLSIGVGAWACSVTMNTKVTTSACLEGLEIWMIIFRTPILFWAGLFSVFTMIARIKMKKYYH